MRTSQHVLDKTFVTGNVDKTDTEVIELEIGEAEIDGDTASLFLRQAVRIRAREGAHERTLSMIDMAGCPDDERRHSAHNLVNGHISFDISHSSRNAWHARSSERLSKLQIKNAK